MRKFKGKIWKIRNQIEVVLPFYRLQYMNILKGKEALIKKQIEILFLLIEVQMGVLMKINQKYYQLDIPWAFSVWSP